jgi:hypothetical protein
MQRHCYFVGGRKIYDRPLPVRRQAAPSTFKLGPIHAAYVDEIRVSNVARYDADFTPLRRFEPDADTLALYHCDEGAGDRLIDSSGHGHDGRLVEPTWIAGEPVLTEGERSYVPAEGLPKPLSHFLFNENEKDEVSDGGEAQLSNVEFREGALYFNGRYEYDGSGLGQRVIVKSEPINFESFTVALRIKADDFDQKHRILLASNSYRWFRLRTDGAGAAYLEINSGGFSKKFEGVWIEAGKWLTLVCGVDLNARRGILFCNGAKVEEFELPDGLKLDHGMQNTTEWTFANYGNGDAFHGLVDEFIVYDRLLTAEECNRIPLTPTATSTRVSRHPPTPRRDFEAEAKARLAKRTPGPAQLVSAFRFESDARDDLNPAVVPTVKNVTFTDGAIGLNGIYGRPEASAADIRSAPVPLRTLSFVLRFKPDPSPKPEGYPLLKSDAGGRLDLAVRSDGSLALGVGTKSVRIGDVRFKTDDWTTIACGVDLDLGISVVYVDGIKVAEESLPLSLDPIGAESSPRYWSFIDGQSGYAFHGQVDELLIYDRMLSPVEFGKLDWKRP